MEPEQAVKVVVDQGWSWEAIASAVVASVVLPAIGEWVRRRVKRRREARGA